MKYLCYSGQASQHIWMEYDSFLFRYNVFIQMQSPSIIWKFVFDWQRKIFGKWTKNSKSNPNTINDTPNRKNWRTVGKKTVENQEKTWYFFLLKLNGITIDSPDINIIYFIIKYRKLLWFFVRLSFYRLFSMTERSIKFIVFFFVIFSTHFMKWTRSNFFSMKCI